MWNMGTEEEGWPGGYGKIKKKKGKVVAIKSDKKHREPGTN